MTPTYIARSTAVAARRLGDEMVVMSALDSTLFTLSEVGAVLWQAADGRTPLDEIVREHVCTAFSVDAGTALRDAEEFVRALAERGILLVSSQPIASPAAPQGEAAAASAAGEPR
ncbi:MAG TPA: PqqD family protein [Candidatus Acidoferrales bacterium]|nr:PqqD family protein [Candidatus Acidoferrales bacterium]